MKTAGFVNGTLLVGMAIFRDGAAIKSLSERSANLFKMFDEAKRRCLDRLRDFTCPRIPLPWAAAIADEIVANYGPDHYPYGSEASRPTLEAFCRYAHGQGVTHRRMAIDDLFPREVRAMARV